MRMVKSIRFLPPNPLAGKARRLPGTSAEELCERATQAIDQAKAPLIGNLEDEANRLKSTFDALMERPGERSDQIKELNAIAFEMKGLGGMFGYPLVSKISGLIFQLTKPGSPATEDVLDVVGLQVDAVALVIRERRKGDGGDTGRALFTSLKEAKDKVLAERTR
jgi:hypothetical protein